MKTIELSIEEIKELQDHFSHAALVGRCDHEDPEIFRKFKYAAGRNYEACRAIVKRAEKEKEELLVPPPAYQNYRNEANVIMATYAKRNEAGDIDYKQDGDKMVYQFTADNEVIVHKLMNELDEKYAVVLAAVAEQFKKADSYYADTKAKLRIFTFPWSNVPEKLGGGYWAAISVMIDGIPDEFSHIQENGLDTQ